MTEDIKETEGGDVEFDFGFDNFRPMGFTFDGVIVSAKIEKPREATYSFIDSRSGKTIVKDAKPQLVVLVKPLDHETKSGNPYPEYLPLTHNSRSKLGIFIEHLRNLGISMGNDPQTLEGREFHFEIKEIDFGAPSLTRVMCPVGTLDDLNRAASSGSSASVAPKANPFEAIDASVLAEIVANLNGTSKDDAIITVATVSRDPRVIAGMADGSLVEYLRGEGLISVDGNRYVASELVTG